LLRAGEVARTRGIHHRVIIIVVLGALTSALSIVALWKVLSLTTAQRIERAREVENEELERMLAGGEDSGAALIGMRGGLVGKVEPPAAWRASLDKAIARGGLVEEPQGASTLIMDVRSSGGRTVWAGYLLQPPLWLSSWRIIVILLTVATALMVAASIIVAQRLARSRAAEQALSQALAVKERLAALGRVAAGVAHEVRNPLASIKLRLDLAAAGASLPTEVDDALKNASSEIARLDRLVADLLVVAGRPLGPRKPSSVGEIAQSRAHVIAPWAQARGVAVEVEGDARASVDPESVGRAVDNLLRNAIEASPQGGRVRTRIISDGAQVRVAVEDQGPGVAEERAGELFEPFFTTKPDGSGLGLAISRAIARAHGGDLVYARTNGVTRFEICVPS
jgi:signal transduction histidine kinase